MLTRYLVYKQDDGFLLTTEENSLILITHGLISKSEFPSYEFDAHTPEEASAIFNLRQGHGPYVPMGEPSECPKCSAVYYPSGSGVCWRCGKIC